MNAPIIFGQPCFGEEEVELVTAAIRSTWIGQGPLVQEFERRFAGEVWAEHAISVSSCTAALELSLAVMGIGPGDEVITTAFTFVATVNAIESVGARPVLVDIDPNSMLLTPDAAEAAVTPRTRAIIPVSFGGRPLDLDGFLDLADSKELIVIEDAAHSVGSVANGMPVGATRHPRLLTCFSFYPNKNLASAEGGVVTLADDEAAERLRSLRLHGLNADAWRRYRERGYQATLATDRGHKANWTDVQAAIALPQLAKLQGFLAAREYLAALYDEALDGVRDVRLIERPVPTLDERHGLHLYQVRVPAARRDPVVQALRGEGIGVAVHYPPIHHHPYYERLGHDGLGTTVEIASEVISLPLHPGLDERDTSRVAQRLAKHVASFAG